MTYLPDTVMLIRATAMRIDWPVLAALLLPPVGVMLLVGRNNDVQIVRSMSLLAICSGAVAAVSFDDEANAVTRSLPASHWCRQGAVGLIAATTCAAWWAVSTAVATSISDTVPAAALAVTGAALFLCGGVIGLVVSRRVWRPAGSWTAVSAFLLVVIAALLAWRPLTVLDPSDPAWARAHQALSRAIAPLAGAFLIALVAPDMRPRIGKRRSPQ